MKPVRKTKLEIQPQTHVRSTKGDKWLFAVSDEYLEKYDARKVLAGEATKVGRNLNRKRQLEKYNAYKEELRFIADKMGFAMPHGHFAIWFNVPYPKSWRPKKVAQMAYKPHQSTPDCDNMIKALLDGIMPRKKRGAGETGVDDRKVHCYAAFKVWVPFEESCIDIVEYDPEEFVAVFEK